MKLLSRKRVMAGIFIFLLPLIVSGEMFLLEDLPMDKTKLGFRFLRPDFKGDDGLSLLSGAYDFFLSIPLSSKLNIVGSIPFAALGNDILDDTEGSSGNKSFGNIYIGLQQRLNSSPVNYFSASLGAFLPTMPENKIGPALIGLFSDFYQFFKFYPNTLTIYGNLAYHHAKEKDVILGGEIGPNIMIPTKKDGDTELYLHYALTAGYRLDYVDFKVELLGLGIITEDMAEDEDRFVHDLAFGVHWNRGKVRPGVFYKIPLNKSVRDIISGVLGLKLEVVL